MEAVAQMLDNKMPYICENGACVFDPSIGTYIFESNSTDLDRYRIELQALKLGTLQFEPGKSHSLSFRVINQGEMLLPANIVESIRQEVPTPKSLQITYSNSAIDVVPFKINKSTAAEFLANELSIDLKKAHAFGDSNNDVELLLRVGCSGAPANASDEVKKIAGYVSEFDNIRGIIDHIEKNMLTY
jgi:HAD superfamily hydrolase (TIGR01484 family)